MVGRLSVSVLPLLTIILENVPPTTLESNVIAPVVKMLWDGGEHLKGTVPTVVGLLQKFAQHGVLLLSSALLLLTAYFRKRSHIDPRV